jgi:hypothetical protein
VVLALGGEAIHGGDVGVGAESVSDDAALAFCQLQLDVVLLSAQSPGACRGGSFLRGPGGNRTLVPAVPVRALPPVDNLSGPGRYW